MEAKQAHYLRYRSLDRLEVNFALVFVFVRTTNGLGPGAMVFGTRHAIPFHATIMYSKCHPFPEKGTTKDFSSRASAHMKRFLSH